MLGKHLSGWDSLLTSVLVFYFIAYLFRMCMRETHGCECLHAFFCCGLRVELRRQPVEFSPSTVGSVMRPMQQAFQAWPSCQPPTCP